MLTLLSLLSVLMLQGLGAFVGRYDTVQRVHRDASFAVLQQHWFVTSVRGLVPVGVFARRFQGDASSFQGTTLRPLAAESGMPTRVRWRIEGAARQAVTVAEGDADAWQVLVSDREELAFEYADSDGRVACSMAERRCAGRMDTSHDSVDRTRRRDLVGQRCCLGSADPRRECAANTMRIRTARLPHRGFILVATLWALAALTLLASTINELVASDRDLAERTRQTLQDDLDARGTVATAMYLLATSRMDHAGLILEREQHLLSLDAGDRWSTGDGVLKVTGQAYLGLGRVRFSLQDETAFASVNRPDPMLVAAFKHVGVTDQQINWLMPRIIDYIDRDQAVVLDGAERYDYVRSDLAPPADWFMATPLELKKVLGVGDPSHA